MHPRAERACSLHFAENVSHAHADVGCSTVPGGFSSQRWTGQKVATR